MSSSQYPPRGVPKNSSVSTFRRYERFRPTAVAHSGINALGPYAAFTKKDAIRNIDVKRDDGPLKELGADYAFMKDKVPSGTTTHIFKTGKLNAEGRLDRTCIETKEAPRNKTDHVSYDPPQSNRPQQRVYDLMMTKPRYSKNF